GRDLRLRLDNASGTASRILELTYMLTPGRAAAGMPSWAFALRPPIVRGAVVGPTRWQVGRATGGLLFAMDGFEVAERWRGQRGLFAAVPAWGAEDCERWFNATDRLPTEMESIFGAEVLAGRQTVPGTIRFIVVPYSLALLGMSLAVV